MSNYHAGDHKMLAHSQSLPQIKGVEKHKAQGDFFKEKQMKSVLLQSVSMRKLWRHQRGEAVRKVHQKTLIRASKAVR